MVPFSLPLSASLFPLQRDQLQDAGTADQDTSAASMPYSDGPSELWAKVNLSSLRLLWHVAWL